MASENLITDHLDLWTSAVRPKSSAGRGSNSKLELTGIKKLRELILELAVRGKLVPQDPSDEPASVLLGRIAAEKAQLVKEGKIKKTKALPKISDEEMPFELPEGWEWCRLDELSLTSEAGWSPQCDNTPRKNEQWGVLKVSAVTWGKFLAEENKALPEPLEPKPEYEVLPGDFLISRANTAELVARAVIAPANTPCKLMMSDKIIRFRFSHFVNSSYICLANGSCTSREYYSRVAGGTSSSMKNVSRLQIQNLIIALPPLSEQKRILDSCEKLMALCDQLEQRSESQLAAHQTLVETLLTTLTDSADADELAQNWARLSTHFDTLFTTEASIDALKQTILQLAVMGKLVPQDPNDEPASVLLDRIATEKARLVKEGKIKKEKNLPILSEEEKPFELPAGWEWCRFTHLSNEIATGPFGSMVSAAEYISGGVPLINPSHMIGSNIVEDKTVSVSISKANVLDSYRIKTGDIVMARRGEMGRCALVTERENDWLCGTGSFVLKFNEKINRRYVILMFQCKSIREYLSGSSVGSTMVNLNHGILNKLPIMLPPLLGKVRTSIPRTKNENFSHLISMGYQ
ncbi:restriction endonuclease subunit S [Aeromonas sp. QDB07]|uniref:restriction endonuclease subunit S n=1 Tax=Aeromonas sp. QDB07 TaxID=2989838 RepID=UPI0022E929E1|nr:restriction endonuclease subunit S [Aeromonas sp. QDB07]